MKCSSQMPMHTLALDLRYAVRTMLRNPGVTAVAVLALALGIGANTAVFTVFNSVLIRPLPFPDADRLARTLAQTALGLAIGIAAALYATRALDKMLYEANPGDSTTMVAVAIVPGLTALASGWIPARRVDPLVALRWQ